MLRPRMQFITADGECPFLLGTVPIRERGTLNLEHNRLVNVGFWSNCGSTSAKSSIAPVENGPKPKADISVDQSPPHWVKSEDGEAAP